MLPGQVLRPETAHSLQAAIGYVMPKDMIEGCHAEIRVERGRKPEVAREERRLRRLYRLRRLLKTGTAVA